MTDEMFTRKELHEELGEFADKVLMPAFESMMDDKLAAQKHELMDHVERRFEKYTGEVVNLIDNRIEKATGEIVATIKGDRERDRTFKSKVVEIFRGRQPAREEELLVLEETMP